MAEQRTADESRDTRALILQRAKELFLIQGYHRTSMRQIAAAAGISTGPLYFHFQNKAEVVFHICNEALERLTGEYRRIAAADGHAAVRLRETYQVYRSFHRQEPQMFEILKLVTHPLGGIKLPAEMAAALGQKSRGMFEVMEDIIRTGIARREIRPVDPKALALSLYSMAEGILMSDQSGLLANCGLSLSETIETAMDVLGLGMVERGDGQQIPECH